MTIELVTGLPGASKTLHTIGHVKQWSEREGRPVFYSGIPELTLGWTEIDPQKWMECPKGAIVVIDECQRVFRNRSLGANPPVYVTELETHRHLGIDLVFITQHPSLVDPAIRRLAGQHRHIVRVWGMEVSTVHKWDSVKDNCDKPASRADSQKTRWSFDKKLYAYYKSSDQHTVKREIPFRVKALLLVPFLVVGAGWYVYMNTVGKAKAKEADASPQVATVQGPGQAVRDGGSVARGGQDAGYQNPMEDAKRYVFEHTPRLVGLPQTAPVYDELTKPDRVPVPAMCIEFRGDCKCKTQDATPMDVSKSMCMEFARNGFFQDFDPERDRKSSEKTAQSVRVLEGRDKPVEHETASAGRVAVFGNPPRDPPVQPAVSGVGGKAG